MQADSIVPGMDNPQRWDRFGYVLNNPLRYTDPSGHSPAGPCPPGDNCDTDQGNGQEDNTEPDSGTDDGGCGGQGCDLGGNNDDDNSTDDGNSRSDDGSIEDQMPDGNPTISQKPLAKTICAVGNKCKVKNAIAGTVIIVVGGFFFIVGAGFSFAAMAADQWELAGATALISAGGGFIAWAGIQALIKSECLPSINWSP